MYYWCFWFLIYPNVRHLNLFTSNLPLVVARFPLRLCFVHGPAYDQATLEEQQGGLVHVPIVIRWWSELGQRKLVRLDFASLNTRQRRQRHAGGSMRREL